MNDVNRTLYIPLYGKALVSRKGVILRDPTAERIWDAEGFELRGKARSRWLAYYMAMRSRVFDMWAQPQLERTDGDALVLHIGCGLDSRALRVSHDGCAWYDIDLPDVIAERRRYFAEEEGYRMISGDARDPEAWLGELPDSGSAVVLLEGITMYLTRGELVGLLSAIKRRYARVSLLMDCYTGLGARLSARGNPIRAVGNAQVYGLDDPRALAQEAGMELLAELDMTPPELIRELQGAERAVFKRIYASGFAHKLYRMYMLDGCSEK